MRVSSAGLLFSPQRLEASHLVRLRIPQVKLACCVWTPSRLARVRDEGHVRFRLKSSSSYLGVSRMHMGIELGRLVVGTMIATCAVVCTQMHILPLRRERRRLHRGPSTMLRHMPSRLFRAWRPTFGSNKNGRTYSGPIGRAPTLACAPRHTAGDDLELGLRAAAFSCRSAFCSWLEPPSRAPHSSTRLPVLRCSSRGWVGLLTVC